jgi:hypothetical protein
MKHLLLALTGCVAVSVQAQEAPPKGVPDALQGITAQEINGHMRFLASDLMKGRDTASDEIRLAAEYLATRLIAAGAEPGGESAGRSRTYFQRFPLEIVTPQEEGTSLSLIVEENGARREVALQLWNDFSLFPRGVMPGEVEAPIVFAGAGRAEDLEGLDVKNRFVLLLTGGPSQRQRATPPRGNAFTSPTEEARKRGALGVLTLRRPTENQPASGMAGTMRQLFGRPSMTLGPAPVSIPTISLTDTVRELLLPAGPDGAAADLDTPRPLTGYRARFRHAATKETKDDRNVIGLFPGSDPEKKKEVVIFSAHYDHVGVNSQGEIMNGSDDNASGTSALLEVAEAFGAGPRPARTVAFLWVSGEEKGLLGSKWFSDHPTLPEGSTIVANINMDMVSRNDIGKVSVCPSPKHADYSTLVVAAEAACKAESMEAVFDADQYHFRTDSYNFARKGIPVVFFFSGMHEDYHRSTDDVEKANFDKAARIARVAYRLGWQVAQASEAPKKIKPDEKKADVAGGAN